MKFSLSLFFVLVILGFLPVSCLWSCKEFYIGKYDIELKTSNLVSSGSYVYDSSRLVVGNEVDSVLNATYAFGCNVTTLPIKVASISKFNFSNYSQCIATSLPSCTDSLQAKFNVDSIHVYCDVQFNGVPAFTSLDSNNIQFSFNIQDQFSPSFYSTFQNKHTDFNDVVAYLNTYHSYLIWKRNSKKPTEYFEPVLNFVVSIKKPTDSNLTKFFIKIYLNNGTVLTTESKKIYWL